MKKSSNWNDPKFIFAIVLIIIFISIGFYDYNKELQYTSGNIYAKAFDLLGQILVAVYNVLRDALYSIGVFLGSDFLSAILFFAILFVIIWFITKDNNSNSSSGGNNPPSGGNNP